MAGSPGPAHALSHAELLRELCAALLCAGRRVRFRASGESMHPTIREGDVITVEPVAPSDIRFADVILYRADAGVIAHRVVRTVGGGDGMAAFLARGDASNDPDEPVPWHLVLGKVVFVERGGRRIALGIWHLNIFHLARLYAYRIKRRMERLSQRTQHSFRRWGHVRFPVGRPRVR